MSVVSRVTVGKSHLTNLIAFYGEVTSLMGYMNSGCFCFSKACDTVSHGMLIEKLKKQELYKGKVKWIKTFWSAEQKGFLWQHEDHISGGQWYTTEFNTVVSVSRRMLLLNRI